MVKKLVKESLMKVRMFDSGTVKKYFVDIEKKRENWRNRALLILLLCIEF